MRRAPAQKRKVDPDPVFRSVLVSQVINKVLLKGKKDLARAIVYDALETVEQRTSQDPTVILKRAVDNIRPQVEVRSRRVGGSNYQVPVEVSPRRQNSLAIRWLVNNTRGRDVSRTCRCASPTRSSTPPTTRVRR
jgi:small subunit ribosomal protein S7